MGGAVSAGGWEGKWRGGRRAFRLPPTHSSGAYLPQCRVPGAGVRREGALKSALRPTALPSPPASVANAP